MLFFYKGNRPRCSRIWAARELDFDLLHMDGAKFNYLDDIMNASRMVSIGGALVIVDDAEMKAGAFALYALGRLGVVSPVVEFPPTPRTDPNRHEIRRVVHASLDRNGVFREPRARGVNGARRVKALWETDSEWASYHPPRR